MKNLKKQNIKHPKFLKINKIYKIVFSLQIEIYKINFKVQITFWTKFLRIKIHHQIFNLALMIILIK